jgi:nucleotide-binding universal stress UspA family protein
MKSILVVADGGPTCEAAIAAGGWLGKQMNGQVDVLHVRDPMALASNMTVAVMAEAAASAVLVGDYQAEVTKRATAARLAFERLAASLPEPRYLDLEGGESELVVAHGRTSDVVVIGRPGTDELKPEPEYVRQAIYEAARPIMIVPPQWRAGTFNQALVAWNGSAQSARALGYAIPVLHRMAKTTVLSVGSERERAPTEAVLRYLGRHGIKASAAAFDAGSGSGRARGRALLQHVTTMAADLLVMGAYGQDGVLRFLGLGGATGKVITACKVPVLLAR